jgi:aryl-alcohol dehydrogenase-like predicted oxidoreductase/spore coat polysaccharide biosynthesis protein SpsF (cytidylyltransferase family)
VSVAQVRVIIQSRLFSHRLPAKALLPVGGLPCVVLCARRAARSGLDVRVATSTDASDDPLVDLLSAHRVPHLRGPLDDVLGRYVVAAADLPGDALVVRLTADAVFPDGPFVEELVARLVELGVRYLGTRSPLDGLPYGLGAEVFTVDLLRQAAAQATNPSDREHVTPWMIRTNGGEPFRPAAVAGDFAHLRCVIDSFEDYARATAVFRGVEHPVEVGWRELVERLARLPGEPRFRVPWVLVDGEVHSRLTLGTAQLGMPYGRTNVAGQPDDRDAREMVRRAVLHGVTHLDCAQAYGTAEQRLGRALRMKPREPVTVVTKLDPLDDLPAAASRAEVARAVVGSVHASMVSLGVERLEVVLLHRWEHRTAFGGEVWRSLVELREAGLIGRVGASVQSPREALEALEDPDVTHLQLPFNVLDRRWIEAGVDRMAAARAGVVVHARSVLLQGVLPAAAALWPALPGGADGDYPSRWVTALSELASRLGRESVADLCFAYVRAHEWITSAVVGAATVAEVDENLRLFTSPCLTETEREEVDASIPDPPPALLDPSTWVAR